MGAVKSLTVHRHDFHKGHIASAKRDLQSDDTYEVLSLGNYLVVAKVQGQWEDQDEVTLRNFIRVE